MYKRDMPIVRDHALASPEGFADLGTFVLLTIQQSLTTVPQAFQDVKTHGASSLMLFGSKRAGYQHIQTYKRELWMVARGRDLLSTMATMTHIPGIGLVKAGFIAQCLGLEVGCIDTHNMQRLGIERNAVVLHKPMRLETRARHIARYINLCTSLGGAEKLWDDWCAYVASPKFSADDISALHWRAMGLCPF